MNFRVIALFMATSLNLSLGKGFMGYLEGFNRYLLTAI